MRGRSDFLWSEATLELVALHAIRGGTVGKPHPATSGRKRFVGREIGLGSAAKTVFYIAHGSVRPAANFLVANSDYRSPDRYRYSEPIPEVVKERRTNPRASPSARASPTRCCALTLGK